MSDSRAAQSLNLGIYGCTHAGKTRFLYQLLRDWRDAGRMLKSSAVADKFLAAVAEEMAAYGHPQPTAVTTTGISLEVQSPSGGAWRLTLRDLRGELLTDEIDDLSGVARRGLAPTQVRECDAFLFFFDPTSAEAPDRLDEHYRREATRAERFVEFVLERRENRLLPIVFVQTRLDLWERDDALRERAATWFREVLANARRLYQERLADHFPPSLVDASKTTLALSNVRPGEAERAISLASTLVDDAWRFSRAARHAVWGKAVLGLAVGAGFLAWLTMLALGGGGKEYRPIGATPEPPSPQTERVTIYDWTSETVGRQLDTLDRLLAAHPLGERLPEIEDARQLNEHLRWMSVKLDQLQDGKVATAAQFSAALHDRMKMAWRRAAETVREKCLAQATISEDRSLDAAGLEVLAAYLAGASAPVAEPESLAAAQAAYWQAHRRRVVERAGADAITHARAGSVPLAILPELANTFRMQEQEARQTNVPCAAREALLAEIQLAARCCENRLDGSYPATWRVASASAPPDSPESPTPSDPSRRRLTFQSPRQPPIDLELSPDSPAAGTDRIPLTYDGLRRHAKLSLGEAATLALARQSRVRNSWELLHVFDIASESDGPSLELLGMPWVRKDRREATLALAWEGYQFSVVLADLPEAPPLLWEVVGRAGK